MKCCHKQDDGKQSEAPEPHLGVPIVLRSRVAQLGDLVSCETLQTNTESPRIRQEQDSLQDCQQSQKTNKSEIQAERQTDS